MVDTVKYLTGGLQETNTSNVPNVASVLVTMSISDANTESLVAGGVLDALVLAFCQSADEIKSRSSYFRYNVIEAREVCSVMLLNLALSAKTAKRVADHEVSVAPPESPSAPVFEINHHVWFHLHARFRLLASNSLQNSFCLKLLVCVCVCALA